jgi:hypothetical protein
VSISFQGVVARQAATAALPQYNSDMRRLFLFPRNQKENLSDAEKQALAKILRPIKQQEH